MKRIFEISSSEHDAHEFRHEVQDEEEEEEEVDRPPQDQQPPKKNKNKKKKMMKKEEEEPPKKKKKKKQGKVHKAWAHDPVFVLRPAATAVAEVMKVVIHNNGTEEMPYTIVEAGRHWLVTAFVLQGTDPFSTLSYRPSFLVNRCFWEHHLYAYTKGVFDMCAQYFERVNARPFRDVTEAAVAFAFALVRELDRMQSIARIDIAPVLEFVQQHFHAHSDSDSDS